MVDSLKELKVGDICFANGKGFKLERMTKVKVVKDIRIVDDGDGPHPAYGYLGAIPVSQKVGSKYKLGNGHVTKYLGTVTYEECSVKTVPPGFTGGKLPKADFGDLTLVRFVSGDVAAWTAWSEEYGDYKVNMEYAFVGEGPALAPPADIQGFTKIDLIAYVMKVNGPSLRDDIMQRVAALEGKPWIPTSNNQYFQYASHAHKKGCACVIISAGKRGRKALFACAPGGEERANSVLARLGEALAKFTTNI